MSQIFLIIKKYRQNKGITLIETIFFIVLLSLMMGVIVQMLFSIGKMYKNMKLTRELESSGTIALESMLREIRNASSVEIGSSVFGVSPGTLTISGVDEDSNSYSITYAVSSSTLTVSKNGETPVALTSQTGQVSYLLFTHPSNTNSEAVRVVLEMTGTFDSITKTERFYGFSVLRGSY